MPVLSGEARSHLYTRAVRSRDARMPPLLLGIPLLLPSRGPSSLVLSLPLPFPPLPPPLSLSRFYVRLPAIADASLLRATVYALFPFAHKTMNVGLRDKYRALGDIDRAGCARIRDQVGAFRFFLIVFIVV